MDVQQNMTFA